MKVFKNLSTFILALGLSAALLSGCKDYLNVSDDLAAEMTMEEVFNNTSYARRFHRYISVLRNDMGVYDEFVCLPDLLVKAPT